ncbi:UbiA prenyltransferase family-domain-containing protein [Daedaleopsis nitida]|nr:UbiA prenyltransferase family-domain-containing protein [Daedaleopsis nitida]
MASLGSPFSAYICRSCAAGIRHARRPTQIRLASTAVAPKGTTTFTSFFFDNHRWAALPKHASVPPGPGQSVRGHSVGAVYSPAESGAAFRPAEVLTPRRLARIYAQLSKSNLTVLVVLTAMSSVALSPLPTTVPVLLSTAIGTALCSASANTWNQIQEVPYDAQMARTRNRPLVRHAISPLHATGFAVTTGVAGPALLWTMVNPTTAILGAANIALYAGAYTYLKRKSTLNTWVGAVVGGIPPLMGWTACGGSLLPSQSFELVLPPSCPSSPPSPRTCSPPPKTPLPRSRSSSCSTAGSSRTSTACRTSSASRTRKRGTACSVSSIHARTQRWRSDTPSCSSLRLRSSCHSRGSRHGHLR